MTLKMNRVSETCGIIFNFNICVIEVSEKEGKEVGVEKYSWCLFIYLFI
jgi:hypothetical protein